MKQTNKSCRLAPLCHLPWNKPFYFMCFLKSRGEEQLEFHKTARGLGLQWVPSYLSIRAGCQQELFQAPFCSRMHRRLMFGGIFCGWQWLYAGEGVSWIGMDAQSEPWKRSEGQHGWGKDLTWRGKRRVQEWSRSLMLQLLLFSFSLWCYFPLLSLPLLVLHPMPAHLLFTCLFLPSQSFLLDQVLWSGKSSYCAIV